MAKISKQEAKKLAIKAGINFDADYHQLRSSQVSDLMAICKLTKYRKPTSASGSTGRYFYSYLQRA